MTETQLIFDITRIAAVGVAVIGLPWLLYQREQDDVLEQQALSSPPEVDSWDQNTCGSYPSDSGRLSS
jgi:hypothetical protein